MYNRQDADERERVETVVHNMVERALEMEGSCTVSTPPAEKKGCPLI
jgi:D-lactate dehydrogenase (cytochrome)